MNIIFLILIFMGISFITGSIFYQLFGWFKFFYHNILHWHMPSKTAKYWIDGCSVHSFCKHCNKEIMEDGQGNWFEA